MTSSQWPELLGIAPELRNIIYHEVARSFEKVNIQIDGSTERVLDPHPLLLVCHQLRMEARAMFASIGRTNASHYFIQLTGFDLEKLSQLADDIQAAKTSDIQNSAPAALADVARPRLHLNFHLQNRTESSAQETIDQSLHHLSAEPGSPRKSPFRYVHVFVRSGLSFDFHFRTKEMTAAEKRQTVTHKQINNTLAALTLGARVAQDEHHRSWQDTEVAEMRRLCPELVKSYYKYNKNRRAW